MQTATERGARQAPHAARDTPAHLIYHHRTQGTGVEAVHISGIARAFERRGWTVRIISPPGVRVDTRPARLAVPATDGYAGRTWRVVSRHAPQWLFEVLESTYSVLSIWRLASAFRRQPADLLYERYALFGWGGTWVARRCGVPIVLEVNDATMITRTRPLAARRLAERLEGWTFRHATHLVTVSQRFKELIVQRHAIDPQRVLVLPNAFDPERFAVPPPDAGQADRPFTIGMVAAFVPWHGVGFLIDGVQGFLKRSGARLLLVGDGPERTVIEERVRRYELQSHVELTGFVPADEVPAYLGRMDVCVIANSNEHGSLMKLFEYMASGKALIAPAIAPVREIVTHRRDGWLFTPLDGKSLLEAITTLSDDPALRRCLGATARQTALSQHTWDHRVATLERWVFPRCLPSGHPGRLCVARGGTGTSGTPESSE